MKNTAKDLNDQLDALNALADESDVELFDDDVLDDVVRVADRTTVDDAPERKAMNERLRAKRLLAEEAADTPVTETPAEQVPLELMTTPNERTVNEDGAPRHEVPASNEEEPDFEWVLNRISEGGFMTDIARQMQMPYRSLMKVFASNEGLATQLAEARAEAAEYFVARATNLLESSPEDKDAISKADKLARHYQWMATRSDPGRFSERKTVAHEGGQGVQFVFNIDRSSSPDPSAAVLPTAVLDETQRLDERRARIAESLQAEPVIPDRDK